MTDGAQRQTKSNGTAAAPRNRRERGRPVQSTGTATKAGNRPPKANRPNAEATAPARKGGERTSGKNRTNQADKTKRQECLRHPAGHNPHRNGTNAMNGIPHTGSCRGIHRAARHQTGGKLRRPDVRRRRPLLADTFEARQPGQALCVRPGRRCEGQCRTHP